MFNIKKLFANIQPFQSVANLFSYILGLCLARYLGATIIWESAILGLIIVLFVQFIEYFLGIYFRSPEELIQILEFRKLIGEYKKVLFFVCFSMLILVLFSIYWLNLHQLLGISSAITMFLLIFLCLGREIPPVKLSARGFGELSIAIQISIISPALAFLLQYENVHKLLTVFTFPLFLLSLAYLLVINFFTYADDVKFSRRTLLVSLTWQRAIPIHNILIFGAYLFLVMIPFFGIPIRLLWPAFLTTPIALFQIFLMNNLSQGDKPNWSIIKFTAGASYGLTLYFIVLIFLLH